MLIFLRPGSWCTYIKKTWRWCKAADFQLYLTIPAPFCVPLSRLGGGDNTKMCEHVGEGEGCV